MNVNFHLNSWYTSIVIANSSGVYCDHLAVCLLLELLGNVTQHKDPYHPIFSSITALADALKAPIDEVKHSLELLHKLGLIQIDYCHEPELFLAAIICIKLNQRRISELSKTNATNNRNGYIYIVRSGSSNLYKIGRTTNYTLMRSLVNQQLSSYCKERSLLTEYLMLFSLLALMVWVNALLLSVS